MGVIRCSSPKCSSLVECRLIFKFIYLFYFNFEIESKPVQKIHVLSSQVAFIKDSSNLKVAHYWLNIYTSYLLQQALWMYILQYACPSAPQSRWWFSIDRSQFKFELTWCDIQIQGGDWTKRFKKLRSDELRTLVRITISDTARIRFTSASVFLRYCFS